MKSHAPNLITLMNLLCGYFSIFFIIKNEYELSMVLILLAVFFDIIDGLVARVLKVSSTLGRDLDSLSDLVSFGVAPSLLIYFSVFQITEFNYIAVIILMMFPLFGAYRLARFNNQVSEITDPNITSKNFTGLPITFAGILLVLLFIIKDWLNPLVILIFVSITMIMMVTTVKIPSFKKRNVNLKLFLLAVIIIALVDRF